MQHTPKLKLIKSKKVLQNNKYSKKYHVKEDYYPDVAYDDGVLKDKRKELRYKEIFHIFGDFETWNPNIGDL